MAKPNISLKQIGEVKIVSFEIPGGVTTPTEFAEAVAEVSAQLPGETGVIVDGRGPVWGYAMLVHSAHPTPWVATRDPRLGAVIVATHSPDRKVGEVMPFPEG